MFVVIDLEEDAGNPIIGPFMNHGEARDFVKTIHEKFPPYKLEIREITGPQEYSEFCEAFKYSEEDALRFKIVEDSVKSSLIYGPAVEFDDVYNAGALQAYYNFLLIEKVVKPYEVNTDAYIYLSEIPSEVRVEFINAQVAYSLVTSFFYEGNHREATAKLIKEFSASIYESCKKEIYEELGYIVDQDKLDALKRLEERRNEPRT